MPKLSKKVISAFIKTGCERQLKFLLNSDKERETFGMPPKQPPLGGLVRKKLFGIEWEKKKAGDLGKAFKKIDPEIIIGNPIQDKGSIKYDKIQLDEAIQFASPHRFILEGEYEVGILFEINYGIYKYGKKFNLEYSNIRPDIIQICSPQTYSQYVLENGNLANVTKEDSRLQLRIIDIKASHEPTPSYFGEVAYYIMILSNWLKEKGLDNKFAVVPNGAIWHGSHKASYLVKKLREIEKEGNKFTFEILEQAFENDLEEIAYDVILFKLKHFLSEDLYKALSQDWLDLNWHINVLCEVCDFAGLPRRGRNDAHCIPIAERTDALCRIAGISQGACEMLRENGVHESRMLAHLPSYHSIYNNHQVLKENRSIIPPRANALIRNKEELPQDIGYSPSMPKWQDLAIYVYISSDLGSDITFSFGVKAIWYKSHKKPWDSMAFIVENRDVNIEKRELLKFLNHISNILEESQKLDPSTGVQFYFWNKKQYNHLIKTVGRHLDSILNNKKIKNLAWLFPPEEILPNADIIKKSYITIIYDIINSKTALPIQFHYSLIKTAQSWHYDKHESDDFKVKPLYCYDLSGLIPSERINEAWDRVSKRAVQWYDILKKIEITVKENLYALQSITIKTQSELNKRRLLSLSAPKIKIGPPQFKRKLCLDSQLWYFYAKLDDALNYQENCEILALAPHVREAKYQSARLSERIKDKDTIKTILKSYGLNPNQTYLLYKLRPNSSEVKFREGDFNLVISPESYINFLNSRLLHHVEDSLIEGYEAAFSVSKFITMSRIARVALEKIDRDKLIIILKPEKGNQNLLFKLMDDKHIELDKDVILDKIHRDFFTKKLLKCLEYIGKPNISFNSRLISRALGKEWTNSQIKAFIPPQPIAEVLWDGKKLNETIFNRNLEPVKKELELKKIHLNKSQWKAWELALNKRLQLIWGPPGTGKSRTIRTVLIGAFLDAFNRNQPLRVLVCSPTYQAIDNILIKAFKKINLKFSHVGCEAYRLRSRSRGLIQNLKPINDIIVSDSEDSKILLKKLRTKNKSHILVGSTPYQIFNLLVKNNLSPIQPLFDLILIDEASQMDVMHAILPLCTLRSEGSIVLAGDLLQLAPIHKSKAPKDLESMVGSIYSYLKDYQGIPQKMLEINYRSNKEIVDFSYNAGYKSELKSNSPSLRLNYLTPIPGSQKPISWPKELYWTTKWAKILNPDLPVVCFTYPNRKTGQMNKFEALSIVSLIWLLKGRLANQLLNDNDLKNKTSQIPYTQERLWEKGIGIVTPHRAQQALIISKLQKFFPNDNPQKIRDAVDTVERFQGQQRDIIIASYALGDPDIIRNEEEFLTSLNRFNVMASRPRAKLIVLVSEEIIKYISTDVDVLNQSRLLKIYAESYCNQRIPMTLGYVEQKKIREFNGFFKFKGDILDDSNSKKLILNKLINNGINIAPESMNVILESEHPLEKVTRLIKETSFIPNFNSMITVDVLKTISDGELNDILRRNGFIK